MHQQLDQINEALATRGDSALAPLPPGCEEAALLPVIKLANIMHYVRRLVPSSRHVVWILYPLAIHHPAQYLQLIDYLREQVEDAALHGTKLIARDSAA
jgi:hypothetical protein